MLFYCDVKSYIFILTVIITIIQAPTLLMYYENLTQTTHKTLQIYFDKFYCGMSQQAQKNNRAQCSGEQINR